MSNSRSVSRGAWMALLAAVLGWMFDGFEMGLFPLVARPALFELIGPGASHSMGTWLSFVIAGFLLGAAVGGLLFGWLGDRIGRVKAMVWSVAVYSIFSGLCAFAGAPWHLAALRFCAALGMGGEWALGVALVMEIWPATKRPLLAGIIGASGNLGFLLIGLFGLVLARFIGGVAKVLEALPIPDPWCAALLANSGWRLLLLMGALPAILTLFIRLFVPESPLWKVSAQSETRPAVGDIFRHGFGRSTLLASALGVVVLIGVWGLAQWIPSWADQLGGKGNPLARSLGQIALAGGAIVGCLIAPALAALVNRRTAYCVFCIASLGVCLWFFGLPRVFGSGFLWGTFLVGIFTHGFFGWLPLYLPELFPTRIRATGQGFAYNAGRILAAVGTLGSGQLLNFYHEDYARMCLVISSVYVAGALLVWLCPETKGRPLPD